MSPSEPQAPVGDFVVISPIRDEAATFPCTAASVLAQTLRPRAWVIVDDGSRDGTGALVDRLAAEHDWIRVVRPGEGGERRLGARIVRALERGLEALGDLPWRFVGKLDGDVELPVGYYARLLAEFEADPGLGIASGECLAPAPGGWRLEKNAPFHTRGPCKVWRRTCLQDIGGLLPTLGWDGLDGYAARMRGWSTRTIAGLQVLHFRPTHRFEGRWAGALRAGRGAYHLHYRPAYLLARALVNLVRPPILLGGLGLVAGYLSGHLRHEARLAPTELAAYIKREQRARLVRLLTGKG